MRAAIAIGLALLFMAAAQASPVPDVVVSSPLARAVLHRDGTYFVTGRYICQSMSAPPRVRLRGLDVGASACLSAGNAYFRVRADMPLGPGELTVLHAGGETRIGRFDVGASTTAPLLSVSPVALQYSGRHGNSDLPPARQVFEIRNAGGGTLTWTVTEPVRWMTLRANELCAVPPECTGCGNDWLQCSGGISGTDLASGTDSVSGSGNATIAVRAPGWTLPSGVTVTGTISITSNGGNANVAVTVATPADVELDCRNFQDDDQDGTIDSQDHDCAANPYAGL